METKAKIIKLFLKQHKPKTIREIAQALHIDYRITHVAAHRLIDERVLKVQTIGKSSLCNLNESYYGVEIYSAEDKRKEEIFKNKDLKQLYKEISSKLNTSFFILLLFGSYAKGTATRNSDIDLMFISNERNFEEKVSAIVSLIPLKTHILVFTEEEFIRMKDSKKLNVVKEALENNIILYGVEAYYKMKNAG